jgi:hypothetical protein
MSIFDEHVTRDGDTFMICQMETSHLENMINVILKQAEIAKSKVENAKPNGDKAKIGVLTQKIHKIRVLDEKSYEDLCGEFAERLDDVLDKLESYIMELFLRKDAIRSKEFAERICVLTDRPYGLPLSRDVDALRLTPGEFEDENNLPF